MKRDIHGHENRHNNWKADILLENGQVNPKYKEEELTKKNSDTLISYVFDMERGQNISNKNVKGGRSPARLNNIRQRIKWIMKEMQSRGVNDIIKVKEKITRKSE